MLWQWQAYTDTACKPAAHVYHAANRGAVWTDVLNNLPCCGGASDSLWLQAARRLASKVVDPATQAVRSPGRVYLFSGLAAVLFVLALQGTDMVLPVGMLTAVWVCIRIAFASYNRCTLLGACTSEMCESCAAGRLKLRFGKPSFWAGATTVVHMQQVKQGSLSS